MPKRGKGTNRAIPLAFTGSGMRRRTTKKPETARPYRDFSGSTAENFKRMPERAAAHGSDRGANYASGTANMGLFERGRSFLGPYVGELGSMAAMMAYHEARKLRDKGLSTFEKRWKQGGEDIKRWFGGITGLGSRETGSTPDLALYTRQVAPPMMNSPNALGLAGELFSNRWYINDGPHSKTLATAVDLYKERSMTLWETNYKASDWFNSQIAQSGINRRGWYAPWQGAGTNENYISANYTSGGGVWNNGGVYDSVGTIGLRHLYHFIRENISANVLAYMSKTDTSDSDLLFPITRTRSTHRVSNNLTESEVEVTAYLLKCKNKVSGHPVRHMFDFSKPNSDASEWPTYLAPQNGQAGPYYWQARRVGVQVANPGEAAQTKSWDGELSTCPGVTPSLSPWFRNHWEIMDVMHQRLQPTDSWDVVFERRYRHPMRWNVFKGWFEERGGSTAPQMPDSSEPEVVDNYFPGDYEIVFSFAGLDGVVSGWQTGVVTLAAPGQDAKIESLNPRNVDCKRSRISKTVHHEISAAWPCLVLKGDQPTQGAEELMDKGFITATQRVPDSALSSDAFSRTVTVSPGNVVEIDNWPAIGGNDAPPRVGSSKSTLQGRDQTDEL